MELNSDKPRLMIAQMSRAIRIRSINGHLAWSGLLLAGVVWMLFDAQSRRAAQEARHPEVQSVVRVLGVADLALSSSSRWLRHPSITEPGAPFADGPAILDNDPAGAAIGPPHAPPPTGSPSASGRGNLRELK
jgi:hypothetical protein